MILVGAGAVLFAPALGSQFILDDYIHRSMVSGTFPGVRGPFDLYDFVDDDNRGALLQRGLLPWWATAHLTIHFFRPLASALLWGDHRLFDDPLPPHLESFGWWILLALAARSLYARRMPRSLAWVATAIFALAPCHALPIAWLANREVILTLIFSALALRELDRWSETGAWLPLGGALLCFAGSMSAGEYGLCFGGYVLACVVLARERSELQRVAALAAFALPATAYLALRARLHCGAQGTGFYLDPLRDPLLYVSFAPHRLALLLSEIGFSLDTQTLSASTPLLALALFVAILLGVIVLAARALRQRSETERRWLLQLFVGALLALTPLLAVAPSPRLGGATMLGLAPCITLFLDQVWFRGDPASIASNLLDRLTPTAALVVGFAHLIHGPATAWLIGRDQARVARDFADHAADLRARLGIPALRDVVVTRGLGGSFFLPFALDPTGNGPPRWTILSQTGHVLALRKGPKTLELTVPKGQGLFPRGHDNLFRPGEDTFAVGDTVNIPGVKVTVLAVDEGGPRTARYDFDRDLDDPLLTWIHEKRALYAAAPPPKVGFGEPFDP